METSSLHTLLLASLLCFCGLLMGHMKHLQGPRGSRHGGNWNLAGVQNRGTLRVAQWGPTQDVMYMLAGKQICCF